MMKEDNINEDNQIEIIERYLKGELQGKLLEAFEQRMQDDPYFRKQVALEKEVLDGLDELALDELQKDLNEIHQEEATPNSEYKAMRKRFEEIHEEVVLDPVVNPMYKSYWRIAAVVTLLIISSIVIFLVYQPSNEPVIAYLLVREVDANGNLARGGATDSLQVMIYPPTADYDHHYQLSETLNLYGPFQPDSLQIFFSPATRQYFLEVDNQRYALHKYDEIVRLE